MNVKHYIGEWGSEIVLDVGENITQASEVYIVGVKPDGTAFKWQGEVVDNTKIKYTTKEGDFDQVGLYRLQAYVVAGDGEWYGETVELYVYDLND